MDGHWEWMLRPVGRYSRWFPSWEEECRKAKIANPETQVIRRWIGPDEVWEPDEAVQE